MKLMTGCLLIAAVALAGCATRQVRVNVAGTLPGGQHMATLVMSEDKRAIEFKCKKPGALGCVILEPSLERGIRRVTLVRYAEPLPSAVQAEIEAHELCHAFSLLQNYPDPCHLGNDGFLLPDYSWVQNLLRSDPIRRGQSRP